MVIHEGSVIGGDARIQDGAIIGKPVALGAQSTASREEPAAAEIGAGATICAGAVVVAGARIGDGAVAVSYTHLTLPTTPYV